MCLLLYASLSDQTHGSYMEIFQSPREEEVWWDLKNIWLRFIPEFASTLPFANWVNMIPWDFTGRLDFLT